MMSRLVIVVLMLALAGCQARRPAEPPALSWTLTAIQPLNVSVNDQMLRIIVAIRNDGPDDARLAGIDATLRIGEEGFEMTERLGGFINLPAGRVTEVRFTRTVPLSTLSRLLDARARREPYRLHGLAVHALLPGRWQLEDTGLASDIDLRPVRDAKPGL